MHISSLLNTTCFRHFHVLFMIPSLILISTSWLFPNAKSTTAYLAMASTNCICYWVHIYDIMRNLENEMDIDLTDIITALAICMIANLYWMRESLNSLAIVAFILCSNVFLGPGAVLCVYSSVYYWMEASGLGINGGEGLTHSHIVSFLQRQCSLMKYRLSCTKSKSEYGNASSLRWMNLGCGWEANSSSKPISYEDACINLANMLGKHVFKSGDGVLSCGCGYGGELLHWKDQYNLAHITGIDINRAAVKAFPYLSNIRMMHLSVDCIVEKFRNKCNFNKIVALDSVYHYANKVQFYKDCFTLLSDSTVESKTVSGWKSKEEDSALGSVGVSDILIKKPLPLWMKWALSAMHVNVMELMTEHDYKSCLETLGYVDVNVLPMPGSCVLGGWFPSVFMNYLAYGLVVGKVPSVNKKHQVRKNVAVIGSGLSGLTSAYYLKQQGHNVTVYEANSTLGLSGYAELIEDQYVDIPLRIIGEGYYCNVIQLLTDLDIEVSPIVEDTDADQLLSQSNYGDNCPESSSGGNRDMCFTYTKSNLHNFFACIPYIYDMFLFTVNVYYDKCSQEETWGMWMKRHGYATERYINASNSVCIKEKITYTDEEKKGGSYDSFLMWLFMGQISWMLSCTYIQILAYPAHIILGFFTSIKLGESFLDMVYSSSRGSGRMMRVKPSMKALEVALTYGIEIHTNTRVSRINNDRLVNGIVYDCVVIATEASAVKHILMPNLYNNVFSSIVYQPSSIYLHTDSSLMPNAKSDWKAFNVCQSKDKDMCMLSAWLNKYYPKSKFTDNIFQTWNPHVLPRDSSIIKVVHFTRVVHTENTGEIIDKINAIQGENGIFYAGAYTARGMGLLEQAAISGKTVAALIGV